MIKYRNGKLYLTENLICIQVSCIGRMENGYSKIIKKEYPKVYYEYMKMCKLYEKSPKSLLGKVQCIDLKNEYNKPGDQKIFLLYNQISYGNDTCYTDYNAMKKSFSSLLKYVKKNKSIPSIINNIGSGENEGGDKNTIDEIINIQFKDYIVEVYNE